MADNKESEADIGNSIPLKESARSFPNYNSAQKNIKQENEAKESAESVTECKDDKIILTVNEDDGKKRSSQSTNPNNQSNHNGLYVLLGLIFNSVCWIILLLLSFFPWFCIYLCIVMTNDKVYVGDKKNHKASLTKTITHVDVAKALYSKKECSNFIQTYQFWTGFGTILNVTLIWLLFLLVYPHVIIKYAFEWQIAIYVFFVTYGILIVFQGMMRTFFFEMVTEYEHFLLNLFRTTKYENKDEHVAADHVGTEGVLLHYFLIAGICALTVGCISQQIIEGFENSVSISFSNVYSWISIIITNILIGCKLVAAAIHFMVEYYLKNKFIKKWHKPS